jgi:hypothetical protein
LRLALRNHVALGGHDLRQPTVLILELLEPLHLGRQQARLPLLPVEVCRLADPLDQSLNASTPADLGNRCAFLALLDNERLLCVLKLRCLHVIPRLYQPENHSGKLQLQTIQFAGIRSMEKPLTFWGYGSEGAFFHLVGKTG